MANMCCIEANDAGEWERAPRHGALAFCGPFAGRPWGVSVDGDVEFKTRGHPEHANTVC